MVPQKVYPKIIGYTGGGKERQDSVYCGLQVLPKAYERVLIHDGARPMVTQDLILRLLQPLSPSCGTVAGVPAKDTVKRVDKDGMVVETLERSQLWNIQTPQCFYTDTIRRCHQQAQQEGYYGTHDAFFGRTVWCICPNCAGLLRKYKINHTGGSGCGRVVFTADTEQRERRRGQMRIGFGYDVHRLVEERKLILGGVEIPYEKGLLGHSDARCAGACADGCHAGRCRFGRHWPSIFLTTMTGIKAFPA